MTCTPVTAILLAVLAAGGRTAAPRPNIVVIMADDMGFSDIGCYGSEISTPHLDRLAGNGLRFTQFYNTARCCPTRATLLTGLYAHQAGVGHMMGDYGAEAYRGDLNDTCVTVAEVLRAAGYSTYMAGKWHVTPAQTKSTHNWPLQRGFEKFFGTIHGAGSFYDPVSLTRDNTPIRAGKGFYYTDAISDHAVQFIAAHAVDAGQEKKPFFLYVSYTSPHWPLHALEKDIGKYKDAFDVGWDRLRAQRRRRLVELGIVSEEWPLTPRDPGVEAWEKVDNKEWQARRMAVYAAQIESMDRGIGRIVEKLETTDHLDKTLILFLADNGGCAEELSGRWGGLHIPEKTRDGRPVARGNTPDLMPGPENTYQSYGVPWANVSNTPFRLYKHWVHEGGISTPLIAHWPRGIRATAYPKGLVREPAHLIDIMATCVDLSGATYPTRRGSRPVTPLEGKSLAPLFRGDALGARALFWEHEGNRAVRHGRWKLVSRFPGEWELYDLVADRSEMNDLAAKHPDRVEALASMYAEWSHRSGVLPWKEIRRCRLALHLAFEARERAASSEGRAVDPVEGRVGRCVRLDGRGSHLRPSARPAVAGKAFALMAWVAPETPAGVILAHGGSRSGYCLYLVERRPCFTVRVDGKPFTVKASRPLADGWSHLTAMLDDHGALRLLVDGAPAATEEDVKRLSANPGEGLQVGIDDGSNVGPYDGTNPFGGRIDEVKLVLGPWSEAAARAEFAAGKKP